MRRTISIIVVIFCIALSARGGTFPAVLKSDQNYRKNIERCFARADFDSCIYYHYLLSSRLKTERDTIELVKTWYCISWLYLLDDDYSRAIVSKYTADMLVLKMRDKENFPQNQFIQIFEGLYNFRNHNYNKAFLYLTEGLKHSRMLQKRWQILCLLYKACCYGEIVSPQKGVSEINKIINELKFKNDSAWFGLPLSLQLKGLSLYHQDRFSESIVFFRYSEIKAEALNIISPFWMYAYYDHILALGELGKYELREKLFQQVTQKFESNVQVRKKLTYYYYLIKGAFLNDDETCLNIYLQMYSMCQKDRWKLEDVGQLIVDRYFRLGKDQKVVEWCTNLQLNDVYDKLLLANSYLRLGEKTKALEIVSKAEKLLIKQDINYYPNLFYLGEFFKMSGNDQKKMYYYNLLLAYNLKVFGRIYPPTATTYNMFGLHFYWKKNYQKALDYFHRSVYSLLKTPYANDYYKIPDISNSILDYNLSISLANKGLAFLELSRLYKDKAKQKKYLDASLENIKLSTRVLHRFKMSLHQERQRYNLSNSYDRYADVTEIGMEAFYKTHDSSYLYTAFEYAERGKSSLLLSMIRGGMSVKNNTIPDYLRQEEEQLNVMVEKYTFMVKKKYYEKTPDLIAINNLNDILYKLKLRQDSLVKVFKLKYPAYYNAKFNFDVISIDSFQRILRPTEVALQYCFSGNLLFTFMVTRDRFNVFTDSLKPSFFSDVKLYRKKISAFTFADFNDTAVRSFAQVSNRLYQVLIKKAESFMEGKKLMIIPDGVLTQIPFEPLVTKLPSSGVYSYKTLSYLIRDHALNYSFSATLQAYSYQPAVYTNTRILAVAPEYNYVNRITTPKAPGGVHDTLNLVSIPGTMKEAREINKIFGGKVLLKKQATEKNFLELAGGYDILHLAMHGVINDEFPMFSKLVFATGKDSSDDGYLNTYEIYNMHINSPLVVLSACNTGAGKVHNGEGIISLARGFFMAGAKSIVMTQWSVADKTSSKIMNGFYTSLASQLCISDALQKSKIDYIDQSDGLTSHPYFWAGYISIGNSSVSFQRKEENRAGYFVYAILSLAFLFSGGMIWRRKMG